MNGPVVVVGIDGLPPALLQRLIGDGLTPNLARLARDGSCGVLRSTPNYQSASAWTSLVTGVNPGKHGILHFTNPRRGSYGFAQIDARARLVPSLWRMLSDAGVRVSALNVPVSYPAEPVEGVMISGWLCPSPRSEGFTWPPDLHLWLAEEFGDYPIHADVRRHATAGHYERAALVARSGIETKLEAARRILLRERPELLCVVVTETDSLQHWCWHLLDDAHPDHDPALSARWRRVLLSVYEALDEALGRLLLEVGEDADVVIVSDHGQAPNSGAQVLLRPWLVHQGYLVPRGGGRRRATIDRALATGFEVLRRRAGNRAKSWLRAHFPVLQSRAQMGRSVAPDWQHTRVWTETGHLLVNTRGRWPEGCVSPGADYETLLTELCEGLLALSDADTGQPAVASVTRGDCAFAGPAADLMPDLLVHWRNDLRVRRLIAGDGTLIERRDAPELPLGAHHPDGTLIACGPRFRAVGDTVGASICDITPTLLHLFGQPVPEYLDGRAILDLPADGLVEEVSRVAVNTPAGQRAHTMAAGGDEVVRGRLRSLGYIE